jgi:hypothetical protein
MKTTYRIFTGFAVLIVTAVFSLALAGCGGKQYTTAELKTLLEKKKLNTAETPYKVDLAAINIMANVREINEIVESAGRYVVLDLSACAAPNNTVGNMTVIKDNVYIKSIIFPSTATSIEDDAFDKCKELTSITIPSSVTSVTEDAFDECTGLTSFTVAAANTAYTSVDGVLFNKDKTTLILYPEGKSGSSYTIPASVTSIGYCAFEDCASLTSVTRPGSVTSIGDLAFCKTSLTSVTIPDGVTSIGDGAFYKCTNLTSVTIPAGVTVIGDRAFQNNQLTSVILPNSVTTIGAYAFSDNQLTSVSISDNITEIGDSAFDQNQITSVTIGANVSSSGSGSGRGLWMRESTERMGYDNGFAQAYNNGGKQAGTYTRPNVGYQVRWSKQ